MFEWIEGNVTSLILTITSSSITLNASAANYFKEVRWCMVGIDKKQMLLGIKPIKKIDIDRKIVSTSQLHKITIGKGYARITNKAISDQIANLLNQTLTNEKISAYYDEDQEMLLADLHELKQMEV